MIASMPDFVFAVWCDDPQVVLDPSLHWRTGAHTLQTNVAGDPRFADALALQAMPEPIDAVVTVDADDPAPVEAALREVARRVVGWEVQRRTPIRPPETPDGEPADAMANVAFLRRPADLDHDEWLARWIGSHTPVASATPATSPMWVSDETSPAAVTAQPTGPGTADATVTPASSHRPCEA